MLQEISNSRFESLFPIAKPTDTNANRCQHLFGFVCRPTAIYTIILVLVPVATSVLVLAAFWYCINNCTSTSSMGVYFECYSTTATSSTSSGILMFFLMANLLLWLLCVKKKASGFFLEIDIIIIFENYMFISKRLKKVFYYLYF